jgi:hypothetical protein
MLSVVTAVEMPFSEVQTPLQSIPHCFFEYPAEVVAVVVFVDEAVEGSCKPTPSQKIH